ncbi:MAG: RnfABCDGE type electron transport complex subunit D [Kiritimatiellaeota bacterium]|nr:RnfABCDGE type electron transport complex subunit D [Kiritimatiellota bacterium]
MIVSSSPHIHSGASVRRVMLDVVFALLPAFGAAVWFFRLDAVRLVAVCVGSALAAEYACRKIMRRDNTLGDWSAVVTGLLLAFCLPPALPSWMAALGSVFAIAVVKQAYGGLGNNPFNPALAARAFLLVSCPAAMTAWTASAWQGVDVATAATPLGFAKDALRAGHAPLFEFDVSRFFFGDINGCLGEVSAAALLAGAAYLLIRRVITWRIPAAYLATVALYALAHKSFAPETAWPVSFHLLSGGLVLGAFFMATDLVTSPSTRMGRLLFGAGCGVLTMVIRTVPSSAYPEGVSFAILVMNALVPLINRATRPKPFGKR